MQIDEPSQLVLMAGKEKESQTKFKYLMLQSEEALIFLQKTKAGSSKDLLVWMLLLNTARVIHQQTFTFTPRWRTGLQMDRKVVYRSLKRLHESGLVEVEFRRGKSPRVSMISPVKGIEKTNGEMDV